MSWLVLYVLHLSLWYISFRFIRLYNLKTLENSFRRFHFTSLVVTYVNLTANLAVNNNIEHLCSGYLHLVGEQSIFT